MYNSLFQKFYCIFSHELHVQSHRSKWRNHVFRSWDIIKANNTDIIRYFKPKFICSPITSCCHRIIRNKQGSRQIPFLVKLFQKFVSIFCIISTKLCIFRVIQSPFFQSVLKMLYSRIQYFIPLLINFSTADHPYFRMSTPYQIGNNLFYCPSIVYHN